MRRLKRRSPTPKSLGQPSDSSKPSEGLPRPLEWKINHVLPRPCLRLCLRDFQHARWRRRHGARREKSRYFPDAWGRDLHRQRRRADWRPRGGIIPPHMGAYAHPPSRGRVCIHITITRALTPEDYQVSFQGAEDYNLDQNHGCREFENFWPEGGQYAEQRSLPARSRGNQYSE